MMAPVFLGLLSGCDKPPTADGHDEEIAGPDVSATPIPAKQPAAMQSAAQADKHPGETATRTADSLKLTIEETPFRDATPAGTGTATGAGWLNREGDATGLDDTPVNGQLLPDLFDQREREKEISVKTEVLLDDAEQDSAGMIDGAGMSIKLKTD